MQRYYIIVNLQNVFITFYTHLTLFNKNPHYPHGQWGKNTIMKKLIYKIKICLLYIKSIGKQP